jgi:hypothetical protein
MRAIKYRFQNDIQGDPSNLYATDLHWTTALHKCKTIPWIYQITTKGKRGKGGFSEDIVEAQSEGSGRDGLEFFHLLDDHFLPVKIDNSLIPELVERRGHGLPGRADKEHDI